MSPSKRKNKIQVRFDRRLVLFNWMLKQFDVNDFFTLAQGIKDVRSEGFDDEGRSYFYYNLRGIIDRSALNNSQLEVYDENIVRFWKRITEKRNRVAGQTLYPKYFQYLSLLFTEIYLDRWFSDKDKLLRELNGFLDEFNVTIDPPDII